MDLKKTLLLTLFSVAFLFHVSSKKNILPQSSENKDTAVVTLKPDTVLLPDKPQELLQFGWTVAMDNGYLAVGTPFYDAGKEENFGKLYLYKYKTDKVKDIDFFNPAPIVLKYTAFASEVKMKDYKMVVSFKNMGVVKKEDNKHPRYTGFMLYDFENVKTSRDFCINNTRPLKVYINRSVARKRDSYIYGAIAVNRQYIAKQAVLKKSSQILIYIKIDGKLKRITSIFPPDSSVQDFGYSLAIHQNQLAVSAYNGVYFYEIQEKNNTITAKLIDKKTYTNKNFSNIKIAMTHNYCFVTNYNRIPHFLGKKDLQLPATDSVYELLMNIDNKIVPEYYAQTPENTQMLSKMGLSEKQINELLFPVYKNNPEMAQKTLETTEKTYVYKKQNGKWHLHQILRSPRPYAYEFFGNSIDAKDSLCVIGAFSSPLHYDYRIDEAYVGAAYVFKLQNDGKWHLACKLLPDKREVWSKFGYSVATDGVNVAVGGRLCNLKVNGKEYIDAGKVFVFFDCINKINNK